MLEQTKTEFNPFTTRVLLCFMFLRDVKKDATVQTHETLSVALLRASCTPQQHAGTWKACQL